MRKIAIARSALAAAMVLALSAGTAMAVTDESTAAFESEGMLHFQPGFEATGYTLKVAGPGNFHRELLFTDEDVLGVPVKSLGQLDDGLYNYEITPIRGFGKRSDERADVVAESPRSEVTSGVFRVAEGKVVLPDTKTPEPAFVADDRDNASLAKDVVHADDVIIDGSLCVGFDCVNGENFGFDTIRLKENNLRIKFDDTSNSGSFPFVDWQLTANDSANGGANKFSIDDITNSKTPFTVEANAPTNSLYVDDGGRLGLGTSTPSVNIHAVNGNTPTLRLEQNGSSGFSAQTWDVAGNETNFFIRDTTNGSTLPFRIRPGAPSSSIYINTDGNVGFGTTAPEGQIHVKDNGVVLGYLQSGDNNAVQLRFKTNSANRRFLAVDASDNVQSQIEFGDNGVVTFFGPTVADTNVVISNDGLNVNGTISLNGGQIHPDYVFGADYALPSIEDHAEYMWTNAHLPKVGAATVGEDGQPRLDIGKKTLGMLEELEIAHIYIDELNKKISGQNETIDSLSKRLEELEKKLVE